MQKMTKSVGYKRKEMEVGDRVILISDIENGLVKLKTFEEGRIIYLQNQVEATVWFDRIVQYASDPIVKALQLDTSFHKNGKLDGITVKLKRESFAIKHCYKKEFEELVVEENKALIIPFFETNEANRMPSNMQRNVGGGVFETVYQYYLDYIIDVVSEGFEDWVNKTLKMRKIKKTEKDNGDFPEHFDTCLTDESSKLFYQKKHELEVAFSKSTGIYYEFSGGLLFD